METCIWAIDSLAPYPGKWKLIDLQQAAFVCEVGLSSGDDRIELSALNCIKEILKNNPAQTSEICSPATAERLVNLLDST